MLKESTTAFGSDFAAASQLPLSYFRQRAADNTDNFTMGAFAAAELIGSAGGFREQDAKRAHIAMVVGMFVHPDHRSTGVGGKLLDAVLTRLDALPGVERIQLEVTVGNASALRLYEQRGFLVFGREPAALKVDGIDYDTLLLSRACP